MKKAHSFRLLIALVVTLLVTSVTLYSDKLNNAHAAEPATVVGSSAEPALQPGQALDGVIEVDLGQGPVRMFSISQTITEDLVKQAGDPELADLIGTTEHESEIERIGSELYVDLNGRGRGVGIIMLGLVLDSDSLVLKSGESVAFLPTGHSLSDHYICHVDDDCPNPVFKLERAEYNTDGSIALAGTFSAQELVPHQASEALAGNTLGPVQGRFDFKVLPIS